MKPLKLIAAVSENYGIGKNNDLPWRLKYVKISNNLRKDMQYFNDCTSNSTTGRKNAVIMGRLTWESIPPKYRPLNDRINCVISKKLEKSEDYFLFRDFVSCVKFLETNDLVEDIWVIGGQEIYRAGLEYKERPRQLYITHVYKNVDCDSFFPKLDWSKLALAQTQSQNPSEMHEENGIKYKFFVYDYE